MSNILEKKYATYLEETIRDMATLPVESICIVAKLKDGGHMMSYYNSSPTDKITIAGLIQQDALIAMMQANKWIPNRGETLD